MSPGRGLPSGTVTFLFTDIEGSTDLLKKLGRDRYESVLAEQSGIVRAAVAEHDGRLVDTQGDSMFCAFRAARDAVSAAIQAQRELESRGWPEHVRVRLRMGLHSGEPKAGEERYVGIGVHRAARIGAAAHGGQILLSESTRVLAEDDLPKGVSLRNLGVHRLKDIDQPVPLYQVVTTGLQDRFPPPRTLRTGRSRRARVGLALTALAIAGGATAGAVLATGSASARPVRLVANSIAVIDPKSGRPIGDVPLGFAPTDVVAGGDKIWVLSEQGRTATAIDPATLREVETVGLDGRPRSQYATGGRDWVALGGAVDEIDANGAAKTSLWRPTPLIVGGGAGSCSSFVTGNTRTVWVSEGRHLAEFDASSGGLIRRSVLPISADSQPTATCYGVRYTAGRLLAARDPDESIGNLNPRTGTYAPIQTSLAGVSAAESGGDDILPWAAGFGRIWLSSTGENTKTLEQKGTLTALDLASGAVSSRTVFGASAGPIAVDAKSGIWVVDPNSERLFRVDPATGHATDVIPLHHFPCCAPTTISSGIAAGHGRIWVALQSP